MHLRPQGLAAKPRIALVFDAHTHAFAPAQVAARGSLAARDRTFAELYADPQAQLATGPELVVALEAAGFDGAFAAGFAFASERDLAEQNEYLLAFAAESAGRARAVVASNPTVGGWERALREAKEAGAVGVGELRPANQGWDPLGPDGRAICALAEELGLFLLWHVSEPVGHRYPGKTGGISAAAMVQLAAQFPGLRNIAAHLGGGAAYYLQMPRVRSSLPNLYFDTAAASLLYDPTTVARLVELAGPQRVIFGSDFPLLEPGDQAAKIRATLSVAEFEAVSGGNAAALLRVLRAT